MKNPYIYKRVSELIMTRDFINPIHSSSIENILHVAGPTVREVVRTMRRTGEPVIATDAGYYMATRPEEVQIVLKDLQSRIASMSKTMAAIKAKAYERFGSQSCFELGRVGEVVPGTVEAGSIKARGGSPEEGQGGKVLHVQTDSGQNESADLRQGSADETSDALLLESLVNT